MLTLMNPGKNYRTFIHRKVTKRQRANLCWFLLKIILMMGMGTDSGSRFIAVTLSSPSTCYYAGQWLSFSVSSVGLNYQSGSSQVNGYIYKGNFQMGVIGQREDSSPIFQQQAWSVWLDSSFGSGINYHVRIIDAYNSSFFGDSPIFTLLKGSLVVQGVSNATYAAGTILELSWTGIGVDYAAVVLCETPLCESRIYYQWYMPGSGIVPVRLPSTPTAGAHYFFRVENMHDPEVYASTRSFSLVQGSCDVNCVDGFCNSLTLTCSLCISGYFVTDAGNCQSEVACPSGFVSLLDHCYFVTPVDTWNSSQSACVAMGGSLVTINSQAENDAITSYYSLPNIWKPSLWIGLYRTDVTNPTCSASVYTWVGGSSPVYNHWGIGEPSCEYTDDSGHHDDRCVQIDAESGYWRDFPCDSWANSPGLCKLSYSAQSQTQTFSFTGTITTWTVPPGVTSLTITAAGAQGGSIGSATGGRGASLTGTFAVTPESVLTILVGGMPLNSSTTGYSFAAGGGGTFVALGSSYFSATPLIVAGGGGGATNRGAGQGGQTSSYGGGPKPGYNGYGAPSALCGGGGGGFYSSGANDQYYPSVGVGGSGFQQGGAGGVAAMYSSSYQSGGFGGGATSDYVGSCNMEGGAGGGYSGGSGLNSSSIQLTGYGGGSYNGGTFQSNYADYWAGNGQVTIAYTSSGGAFTPPQTVQKSLQYTARPVTGSGSYTKKQTVKTTSKPKTACVTNCARCTTGKECSSCAPGYYLHKKKCKACHKGCKTCDSSTNCLTCELGLYLSQGNCASFCPDGTYGQSGVCTACLDECATCKDGDSCMSCNPEFFHSKGKCSVCPLGCYFCDSLKSCSSCQPGFFLVHKQCVASSVSRDEVLRSIRGGH